MLTGAFVTYGGVSLFVASFVLAPMAEALFWTADLPHRLMPAALALGTSTFTLRSTTPQFGRICVERIHGKMKLHWFLQTLPAPPPNNGVAETLDVAKAALVERYEEFKRGK